VGTVFFSGISMDLGGDGAAVLAGRWGAQRFVEGPWAQFFYVYGLA